MTVERRRVLFLGNVFPLPIDDGTKMRVVNLLQAVADVADVDFFTLYGSEDPLDTAQALGVARVGGIRRAEAWRSRSPLLWLASTFPRPWAYRDVGAARTAVEAFARGPYDLVWYSRVETLLCFGPLPSRRRVLDFDVLEDERIATSGRLRRRSPLHATADFVDRARWRRLQHRILADVDAALVCSSVDQRRLGHPTVRVVPNGYEEGETVVRKGSPEPTVGFVGSFAYGPNIDAARILIERVMPVIRSLVTDTRLLLVGRHGDKLFGDSEPWVEATGYVDRVEPWLGRIDVMAVPVRYGGGTRIKILEALCHRIPLAAYEYAVEGIEVVDGIHARLASNPEELAMAVVDLLHDPVEAQRLASAGRALFHARYRWSSIRARVARLVEELTQR